MKEHPRLRRPVLAGLVGAGLAAMALAGASIVRADVARRMPAGVPAAYTQECGACHVAYPPALLPARSWQRVMAGLDAHYGTDASLDAATTRQLSDWLTTHAGTSKRVREEPPQNRITRSAWFARKHDEVAAAVWTHPSVKSAANCSACHAGAEQGVFDEHDLRIPAGLDARHRRAWD